MCICDLKPGEAGKVSQITCNDKLTKRLLALGCIEGTEITLKMIAPLGDPIIVNLRGTDFALRKQDAKNIFIK